MYIKTIADLETAMLEALEKQKAKKNMNPVAAKGLNAMRQKIRKNNRDHDADIKAYRDSPDEFMKEDVVEEPTATAPKKAKKSLTDETIVGADDDGFSVV